LSGELQDADAAWDFLGRVPQVDPSRRGLLGFSLGGYVAARCAAGFADSGLKALALWAPVEDPRCITMHFGGLHGEEKMASGGMVDIGGLSLGPGFVRDLIRQVSQKPGEGWRGPVFLAQGDRDQAVPLRAMDDYRATFLRQGADFQGLVLQSAKHLFDDVVSRGRLYDGTESFLLRHLRDGKTPETGRP
jgi:dienelactone hydrolase